MDLVGIDLYTDNPSDAQSDYNQLLTYGKPVVLSEFGSGSPTAGDANWSETTLISQIKSSMPQVVLWQQWVDGPNGNGPGWGMAQSQNVQQALSDPWVLNRGNIGFFNQSTSTSTSVPTASPNDTGVAAGAASAAITDANGDVYTLSSDNRMLVNGAEVSGGEGTSELDYSNGTLYAQDQASGALVHRQRWNSGYVYRIFGARQPRLIILDTANFNLGAHSFTERYGVAAARPRQSPTRTATSTRCRATTGCWSTALRSAAAKAPPNSLL